MELVRSTVWSEVFEGWRQREAFNPAWVRCATEVKGWPDWQSWRGFTASQIGAEGRKWQIFRFTDPLEEIPQMLLGPYSGWQSKVSRKNSISFREMLEDEGQREFFRRHEGVQRILQGLPFTTEFIGLVREDVNKIVCLEGHHRAVAFVLAFMEQKKMDFSGCAVTIALASLPVEECPILDKVLERGTSKEKKDI